MKIDHLFIESNVNMFIFILFKILNISIDDDKKYILYKNPNMNSLDNARKLYEFYIILNLLITDYFLFLKYMHYTDSFSYLEKKEIFDFIKYDRLHDKYIVRLGNNILDTQLDLIKEVEVYGY